MEDHFLTEEVEIYLVLQMYIENSIEWECKWRGNFKKNGIENGHIY